MLWLTLNFGTLDCLAPILTAPCYHTDLRLSAWYPGKKTPRQLTEDDLTSLSLAAERFASTNQTGQGTSIAPITLSVGCSNVCTISVSDDKRNSQGLRDLRALCENRQVNLILTRCSEQVKDWAERAFSRLPKYASDTTLIIGPIASKTSQLSLAAPSLSLTRAIDGCVEGTIRAHVRQCLFDCYEDFSHKPSGMDRLRSTPLYASGFFNATLLIGNPEAFPWICLLIADQIGAFLDAQQSGRTYRNAANLTEDEPAFRLLASTRNGAVLAASTRYLIEPLPLDVIDRLGPWQRAIEEYNSSSDRDYAMPERRSACQHIYVGDFVIAGSELRTAEAHAHSRGGRLVAAIVIGSVVDEYSIPLQQPTAGGISSEASQFDGPTASRRHRTILRPLFSLQDVRPELHYAFPKPGGTGPHISEIRCG